LPPSAGLLVPGLGNETHDTNARRLLEPLAGVLVSHAAHLLSALALYRLGRLVWGDENRAGALVAALLHILSPAGLFLSAPYAESGFALLTFAGYWAFAKGIRVEEDRASLLWRDAYRLVAGILFGLATAFRSNGLLNGIPFAWAFLQAAIVELPRRPAAAVRELLVLGVGGVCVAGGSIVPQAVAYLQFCRAPGEGLLGAPNANPRPWCNGLPPSIYTFVQAHYW
jgi:GPI mannosyltransferase 2